MRRVIKGITRAFLLGLFTLIPSALTVWLLWFLLSTTDQIFKAMLSIVLPGRSYSPGLGLVAALIIICAVGVAMQATALPRLVTFLERIVFAIPLIRTAYGAFKDFSDFLSGGKKEKKSRMVLVRVPNSQHRMLGLVTQENPGQDLGPMVADHLLVYFPMSYQLGGYALLVNKSDVEALKLPVDDAMRYILTAGISHAKR